MFAMSMCVCVCVHLFVPLCMCFFQNFPCESEWIICSCSLSPHFLMSCFFFRGLLHTNTHAHTFTLLKQDCTDQGIAYPAFSVIVCFFPLMRRGRQNKAPCFVLHFLSVSPKKKPLGASLPYALYIPLIPLCHYACSDFLDKRFWTERQMKCWEAGC